MESHLYEKQGWGTTTAVILFGPQYLSQYLSKAKKIVIPSEESAFSCFVA
jgi:hypothetical protein